VPFFLTGGTALVTGRGEHVRVLPDVRPFWIVIVKPLVSLSTKDVFRRIETIEYTDGHISARMAEVIANEGHAPFGLVHNTLERAAHKLAPQIAEVVLSLENAGAETVCMSGSGSAIFALFEDVRNARAVISNFDSDGVRTWLVRSVSGSEFMHTVSPLHDVS